MEFCKQYFTVKYVRIPDLLLELEAARNDSNFIKVLGKYEHRSVQKPFHEKSL